MSVVKGLGCSLFVFLNTYDCNVLTSVIGLKLRTNRSIPRLAKDRCLFKLLLLLLSFPFVGGAGVALGRATTLLLANTSLDLANVLCKVDLSQGPTSVTIILLFRFA